MREGKWRYKKWQIAGGVTILWRIAQKQRGRIMGAERLTPRNPIALADAVGCDRSRTEP